MQRIRHFLITSALLCSMQLTAAGVPDRRKAALQPPVASELTRKRRFPCGPLTLEQTKKYEKLCNLAQATVHENYGDLKRDYQGLPPREIIRALEHVYATGDYNSPLFKQILMNALYDLSDALERNQQGR